MINIIATISCWFVAAEGICIFIPEILYGVYDNQIYRLGWGIILGIVIMIFIGSGIYCLLIWGKKMKVELDEIYYLMNSVKFDDNLIFSTIKHPTVDQERVKKITLEVFDSIINRLEQTYPEYNGPRYWVDVISSSLEAKGGKENKRIWTKTKHP